MSDYSEWMSASRGSKRGRARRGGGNRRSRGRGGRRGHHTDNNYEGHTQTNFFKPKNEESKLDYQKDDTKHGFRPSTATGSQRKAQPIPTPTEDNTADIGAWGDEIPDFLMSSNPPPEAAPKSKGKKKTKPKTSHQKERNEIEKDPQNGIDFIVKDERGIHKEDLKLNNEEVKEMIPKIDSGNEPLNDSKSQEISEEIPVTAAGVEQVSDGDTKTSPIETEDKLEPTTDEQSKEEEQKEETEEERKKREEEEKRAQDIELLEKQIQDQEALMFDWGNLEETMDKQRYIDELKEELYYLKNPDKKRKKKGKKKNAKKSNLIVSISKPQLSKNSIVKQQLMTEKSVRLWNDPDTDISNIKLDKMQKGMFNRSNNCFMNVILQSLLSVPVFFNFLVHFDYQIQFTPKLKEIFDQNKDDTLLIANFLELVKYFNPDTGGIKAMLTYGTKTVDVEGIFRTLLMNFNPDRQQQDCHEFLGLMLDTLNNEMNTILEKAGIKTKSKSLIETSHNIDPVEEWAEKGKKRVKLRNKAEDLIKNSPIFEIFGGCMREDICIEGKKTSSARLQPYLYLSLDITMECTIESSLEKYFEPEELEDYRVGQKEAYATKTHSLLTVPNILILQIKRFLYIDGPVKTWENVYYPDILELKDEYFAPEIQAERKEIRKAQDQQEGKNNLKHEETKKKPAKKTKDGVKVNFIEQSEEEKKELSSFKHLEKYELIGVIVHKGKQMSRGHYVALNQDSYGNWVLYDDKEAKVVASTPTQVANIVLSQQAYVLIYRKFT